jgi:FkbM family methyltransferase
MNLPSLPELIQRYNLSIRGVIHIGAHTGQEYPEYAQCGIKHMMFFEPLVHSYKELQKYLATFAPPNDRLEGVETFNMALGNEVGVREMYVETFNHGMSSSLLRPKAHLQMYPRIVFHKRELVRVNKLDNIDFDCSLFNMINIDVQGFELEVFRGAAMTLDHIDVIRSEINMEEMYEGCVLVYSLDLFLACHGFKRVLTDDGPKRWGEAIYLKGNNDNS